MWLHTVNSPIGALYLTGEGGAVTGLYFRQPAGSFDPPGDLGREAEAQLRAYFAGERRNFDLPLRPEGTDFQKAVWQALRTIPYGETRSYGQIAAGIGRPRACRAVGMANHRNPISILIPCHRVVGSDGCLTGYGGGLERKAALLALERGEGVSARWAPRAPRALDSGEELGYNER